MTDLVRVDRQNDIAIFTLNDPATMNAASLDMAIEFLAALEEAQETARCVVVTGEGRGFCSGANLSSGIADRKPEEKPDAGIALDSHYNPLIRAIRNHPTPIITAVNGAAAGVGCSIALSGDLIVASEKAYFLQAFSNIGLVPDGGSTWMLARTLGRARAMEMTLLAERIPAEKALEWGLVNRVVSPEKLMEEALELAERLANGPASLAITRQLMWQACDATLNDMLQAERFAQRTAGRTPDFAEGVSAFLQKRPAKFKGK